MKTESVIPVDAPIANDDLFRIEWGELICPLGNTSEYRFLKLLIGSIDRWVSYNEIAESALDDRDANNNSIRNLKYRVVKKLSTHGMQELAERIRATKEHYLLMSRGDDRHMTLGD